ncbi:phosphatidate cytidylyltransferase [Syntrophorhabdus aromaticivorans]|uniref:Phosphatidate cytidylyltransferase n=1 Tax=Syntrophorhabdus aromaticivorans TaxID=328301 RepID=A0A351U2N5_9BACT|nr:phosphatidate cytidylyltransferase [Syntrophorhabdus aromaticivorans]NLW36593.1 phosphatidate cytidylyltransferase [Syntrophorhabdus aromaticivorans]HBA54216.1 phosphatidate cytidylyltransferase [Syntrophorhabdus aromaticivorans]
MNNLTQRVLTALCAAPVIIAAFYFLPPRWFFMFLAIVALLATFELVTMSGIRERYLILSLAILGFVPLYTQSLQIFVLWLLFAPVIYMVTQFLQKESIKKENINRDIMRGIFVILLSEVFVVLPLFYMYLLKEIHTLFPLVLLFALWASDTTAYMLGKAFGKKLLVPRISPKKTYEGLLGAIVGPMIVMMLSSRLMGTGIGESMIVGGAIGVLGQIGDIFESAGKRVCEVKDSSSLIPGHGGILDRMDSFIFAAPFLYHYLAGIKFVAGMKMV